VNSTVLLITPSSARPAAAWIAMAVIAARRARRSHPRSYSVASARRPDGRPKSFARPHAGPSVLAMRAPFHPHDAGTAPRVGYRMPAASAEEMPVCYLQSAWPNRCRTSASNELPRHGRNWATLSGWKCRKMVWIRMPRTRVTGLCATACSIHRAPTYLRLSIVRS